MEYVFGTKENIEVLKTKGDSHTCLTGFHQLEQTYPDQTITDSFRIVRKLGSDEDAEGNCYDWYEIDHHYRVADKTGPIVQQMVENEATMENLACELDTEMDERISAIENAVCELDAAVNNN